MNEQYVFIDLDGVILDSQQRMLQCKLMAGFTDHSQKQQFDEYFEYTNSHLEEWDYIIRGANSINNSVEIIRQLQQLNRRIAILTKIHTLYEMKIKVEDLRNHRKIHVPVLFVPPGVKKHEIVIPKSQLLIDDSPKNVNNWINHGGRGLIFDQTIENDDSVKVKSLSFLLKE